MNHDALKLVILCKIIQKRTTVILLHNVTMMYQNNELFLIPIRPHDYTNN